MDRGLVWSGMCVLRCLEEGAQNSLHQSAGMLRALHAIQQLREVSAQGHPELAERTELLDSLLQGGTSALTLVASNYKAFVKLGPRQDVFEEFYLNVDLIHQIIERCIRLCHPSIDTLAELNTFLRILRTWCKEVAARQPVPPIPDRFCPWFVSSPPGDWPMKSQLVGSEDPTRDLQVLMREPLARAAASSQSATIEADKPGHLWGPDSEHAAPPIAEDAGRDHRSASDGNAESTMLNWQSLPVFVSSTFKDMHRERDYLFSHVMPRLAERARSLRVDLQLIDLRQGILTNVGQDEADRDKEVMKVCLDSIDNSHYVIVLLGDRYGWVPGRDSGRFVKAMTGPRNLETESRSKSITAIEIEYAIKKATEQDSRCFIYQRDLSYDDIPPEVAASYCDALATDAQTRENAARLAALKERLAREMPGRVRPYSASWDGNQVTGFDQLADMVIDDLWRELQQDEVLRAKPPDDYELFVRRLLWSYHGRGMFFDELLRAVSGGTGVMCVTGAPGSGKSALFVQLCKELETRDVLLLRHAAGVNAASGSTDGMLRDWVADLAASLRRPNPLVQRQNASESDSRLVGPLASVQDSSEAGAESRNEQRPPSPREAFVSLIEEVAPQRHVVVALDGVDQLSGVRSGEWLGWLPDTCPENVSFVLLSRDFLPIRALAARADARLVPLPPLEACDARSIIADVYRKYGRSVPESAIDELVAKRDANGNLACSSPLWVQLAAEELNLLDADFFTQVVDLANPSDEESSLKHLIMDTVRKLPGDVEGLYLWMLDRTERAHGADVTAAFVNAIALSRHGWRETDLLSLVEAVSGNPASNLLIAQLRRAFDAQIVLRTASGRWCFSHSQLAETVCARNLSDPKVVQRLHAAIADHLWSLHAEDPVRQDELTYHLMHADDRKRAAEHYISIATNDEFVVATNVLTSFALGQAIGDEGLQRVCSLLEQPFDPAGNLAEFDLRLYHEAPPDSSLRRPFAHREDVFPWRLCQRFLSGLTRGLDIAEGNSSPQLEAVLNAVWCRLRELRQRNPAHEQLKHDYSLCLNELADCLTRRGRGDEARKLREQASALWRSQERDWSRPRRNDADSVPELESMKENERIQRWLTEAEEEAVVIMGKGDALYAEGRFEEALAAYDWAASSFVLGEIFVMVASFPYPPAQCMEKTGKALLALGRSEEAERFFMEAHNLHKRCAERKTADPVWRQAMAVNLEYCARACSALGHYDKAVEMAERALALNRQLRDSYRNKIEFARNHAHSLSFLADKLIDAGRSDECLAPVREALGAFEQIAATSATPQALHDLCLARRVLAIGLGTTGSMDEARRTMDECRDALVSLRHAAPEAALPKHTLAETWRCIGLAREDDGNLEDAANAYNEALASLPGAVNTTERPTDEKRLLLHLCMLRGNALLTIGRPNDALEALLGGISSALALWCKDQESPTYAVDLFGLRWMISQACENAGQLTSAIANLRTCSGLIMALRPDVRDSQSGLYWLAMTEYHLARLALAVRRVEPVTPSFAMPHPPDSAAFHLNALYGILLRMQELNYEIDPFLLKVMDRLSQESGADST